MEEQTFVSIQSNMTASDPVCNWTEGRETTGTDSSQPVGPQPAAPPRLPPPPTVRWHTVMEKNYLFFARGRFCCRFHVLSVGPGLFLCSEAWISRFWQCPAAQPGSGTLWGSHSTSLDVAVVIRAVCLGHIHLSHGLTHVVHPVLPRWHALIDAVQAFSLLEAGDLVLGGEPTDGWKKNRENTSVSAEEKF